MESPKQNYSAHSGASAQATPWVCFFLFPVTAQMVPAPYLAQHLTLQSFTFPSFVRGFSIQTPQLTTDHNLCPVIFRPRIRRHSRSWANIKGWIRSDGNLLYK